MKKNSFLLGMLTAILASLLFLLLAGNSMQDTNGTGRHQLEQGYYAAYPIVGEPIDMKTIFKIDTQTGESWFFVTFIDSIETTFYWRSIR